MFLCWFVLVDMSACGLLCLGKSSVLKSLGGVSSVLTNIILATSPHSTGAAKDTKKSSNKEDAIVMDTKLKIIDILKVCACTERFPTNFCFYNPFALNVRYNMSKS